MKLTPCVLSIHDQNCLFKTFIQFLMRTRRREKPIETAVVCTKPSKFVGCVIWLFEGRIITSGSNGKFHTTLLILLTI